MKIYNCLECGKECKATHQKKNIYCSNSCQRKYQFRHETLPRFYEGKIFERPTLRKLLTETVGYKCACCGINEWNGQDITLQVDHIDGNAGNNLPDNLQLLCPNCHSQSKYFSGRNKGNGRASRGLPLR